MSLSTFGHVYFFFSVNRLLLSTRVFIVFRVKNSIISEQNQQNNRIIIENIVNPHKTHNMEVEASTNIDTDAFLPPSGRQQPKAGKKRTVSTAGNGEEQMQIDETTGIEGARKTNAPKTKRKKHTNVEIRKIPVPPHRFGSTSQ